MSLTHRVGLLAGAATLALAGVGFGETRDGNSDALAEIAKLKEELAALKAQQGDNWLTEQRASEIRSLVQDVLADADSRASLQASGMTAGWDKGFFLASPDGKFKLRVSGQVQFRWVLNYRDIKSANIPGEDRWTHGFENRRTKLTFSGTIFDKTWTYKVQGNFARDGGEFGLEDAWLQKDFDNGFYVRFGQFKAPFLREELVSSRYQLAVERSLLNHAFSGGRTQGIEAGIETDVFRIGVMYNDGAGQDNYLGPSQINSPWDSASGAEWAFTARAEFIAAGNWSQFDEFTSWNGESFGLMIGAAVNAQRDEFGTGFGPEQTRLGATFDVTAKFGGANIFGAFIYNNPDIDDDAGLDADQFGFLVQGGIFVIPDAVEIFGRYEYGDPDGLTFGEGGLARGQTKDLSVLTVGVNWYLAKQSAKFTADVGFSFEDFFNTWADSGAGWLNGFGEDEIVLRTQFQLLF